jgi:hypothetical protein
LRIQLQLQHDEHKLKIIGEGLTFDDVWYRTIPMCFLKVISNKIFKEIYNVPIVHPLLWIQFTEDICLAVAQEEDWDKVFCIKITIEQ